MGLKVINSTKTQDCKNSLCERIQKSDAYLAITCVDGHWKKHCIGMNDFELVYYLEQFKQQVLNDEW